MSCPNNSRSNPKLKLLLLGGSVVLLTVLSQFFNLQNLLQGVFLWVENLGILAPVAFIIIYNLATLLLVPGSLLTLKGGCLFGLLWGSIYVSIAALLGAIGAFFIGRYLSRDWVCQKMERNPKFKAIDEAVKKEGLKIVFLTRLSPLFPFNLLNYALGVTSVSLKDYIIGSLGMIPATVMYVYMGSLARDLAAIDVSNPPATPETQIAQWGIQGIGLIATIAVTLYASHLAKKALNRSPITERISHARARNR
ncbi:MAG: TVP38/TMEM64 family protein [Cyanobacteriota bacterium]|nr:TVP38/TMEM64 family protein [Cyanobacteriota bacterium]